MQTQPTEINRLVLILQIAVPGIIAGIVALIAYSRIAKRMEDYKSSLAADLKSLESSLNKNLEEYKIKLSEKRSQRTYPARKTRGTPFHNFTPDAPVRGIRPRSNVDGGERLQHGGVPNRVF